MLVVNSENSGCNLNFLFSQNWCRDLNSMSRPHSLCLYCISVSRPRFDVTTSFLLSSSLLLCHCSYFHVAMSLSCLEPSSRSRLIFTDLLIFLLRRGHQVQPSSFFNQCNSCCDLNSMSRPGCLAVHDILCRDLNSMSRPHFFC